MTHRVSRRGSALVDLLVVAALLVVLSLAALPRLAARTREQANRISCAAHLAQIGQAMKHYSDAQTRTYAYPRTRYGSRHYAPDGRDNIYTFRSTRNSGNDIDPAGRIGPPAGSSDTILLPIWDPKRPVPVVDLHAVDPSSATTGSSR